MIVCIFHMNLWRTILLDNNKKLLLKSVMHTLLCSPTGFALGKYFFVHDNYCSDSTAGYYKQKGKLKCFSTWTIYTSIIPKKWWFFIFPIAPNWSSSHTMHFSMGLLDNINIHENGFFSLSKREVFWSCLISPLEYIHVQVKKTYFHLNKATKQKNHAVCQHSFCIEVSYNKKCYQKKNSLKNISRVLIKWFKPVFSQSCVVKSPAMKAVSAAPSRQSWLAGSDS